MQKVMYPKFTDQKINIASLTQCATVCDSQISIVVREPKSRLQVHDRKSQTTKYRTDNMKKINPRTKDQKPDPIQINRN
jgi:hypothetical protein